MRKLEEVELTNMCMILDGKGNVLVQNRKSKTSWRGWMFPGGHVEPGEYVTPSVIREVQEETGLTLHHPRLCGIKEFRKQENDKRYIVFLYRADAFSGDLQSSAEGEVFWVPLQELENTQNLAPSFAEMLRVFLSPDLSEVYYNRQENQPDTVVYC